MEWVTGPGELGNDHEVIPFSYSLSYRKRLFQVKSACWGNGSGCIKSLVDANGRFWAYL
jgi:hypothetical protein